MSTVVDDVITIPDLTLSDRCDKCGAQAFGAAIVNGTLLRFCGHHYGRNEMALVAAGYVVSDQRHRINEKADSSANV